MRCRGVLRAASARLGCSQVGRHASIMRATPRLFAAPLRHVGTLNQTSRFLSAAAGSKVTVNCPSLGDSITEGTVSSWAKKVGDSVAVDDVVVVIETDKISADVRSPHAGVISELFHEEGAVIDVGKPLFAVTLGEGAAAPAPSVQPATAPPPAAAPATPPPAAAPAVPPKAAAAPPPKAPEKKPASAPSPPAPSGGRTERRVKLTRMRLKISERLKESQNTAASLTTFNEIDMSGYISLRNKYKDEFADKHGVKLGFMSIFVKAAVAALKEFPAVNAIIDGGEIVYRDYVDISVAVATPKGLVVPVLRNCETMSMAGVEKAIGVLSKKARDEQLALEDMAGGTFTISNGGVYGSLFGTPIINQPQSAILGMHGTFDRPVVVNGKVEVRPMMYVALTYDHRIIDGREAVTFLRKVKSAVEDPAFLLLEL
eukprot:TRINITY_DN35499_c0_g2_i2.p2 TRINITY_DN35499_c0_g2~~TRINITY_DN35499_c0_g2_i2.p2  ORF type:complete len:429 (+),score=136.04 TRINITY_DN35499_c0_g2_i2:2363-3649(+)